MPREHHRHRRQHRELTPEEANRLASRIFREQREPAPAAA
jgi:hypothetical protein